MRIDLKNRQAKFTETSDVECLGLISKTSHFLIGYFFKREILLNKKGVEGGGRSLYTHNLI